MMVIFIKVKKSKSVTISENGEEIAKKLIEKYLK